MGKLVIAGREFSSRLFVGTGKYPSPEILSKALDASGTNLVTVALRRVSLSEPDPVHLPDDFGRDVPGGTLKECQQFGLAR